MRIVLAGDGDKMSYFQKRAAGASNIVFPGWINKAQAWTLMQCAGAGIIPYESSFDFCRSFPNKIIEYLSAGLPVISSIRGVASEYLDAKKCGITYPNKDASALANVIQMLEANRGSLGEMSERAMSAYKHEFIADTVYGRMAEHLEKLTMQADVVMSDARQYAVNGKQ